MPLLVWRVAGGLGAPAQVSSLSTCPRPRFEAVTSCIGWGPFIIGAATVVKGAE